MAWWWLLTRRRAPLSVIQRINPTIGGLSGTPEAIGPKPWGAGGLQSGVRRMTGGDPAGPTPAGERGCTRMQGVPLTRVRGGSGEATGVRVCGRVGSKSPEVHGRPPNLALEQG